MQPTSIPGYLNSRSVRRASTTKLTSKAFRTATLARKNPAFLSSEGRRFVSYFVKMGKALVLASLLDPLEEPAMVKLA